MRVVSVALVSVGAIVLAGCLNTSTLIRVAPDGSGTIVQTLLFNPKSIDDAFSGMGFKSTGGTKSSSSMKPMGEGEMRQQAATLGKGVSLVSVVPVKQPSGFEGVTATFAFEDITKLRTEDFLMPGPASEMASGNSRDRIAFALARGANGSSILTATFNETPGKGSAKGSSKSSKGGPGLDDPEVRQLVKALFKGFRIGVDLEVVGQIVQTDADYVMGKRITLAEIDMEQLLLEGKKLESLDSVLGADTSIAKMRPYLKDIKGLKINRPVITIEFR